MIISRTPFRVSFFGGGTDFPDYYREHGGAVLSTAINKYCYLSVHSLGPFFKHRLRVSYAQTETVKHPTEIKHPLIRECLAHLGLDAGMEINHVADLPGRTGLGSSSSFTVGLLHALHAFRGESPNAEQLAQEAIVVERERVGDSGGHQDQYAAAFGGLHRYDFSAKGIAATPIEIPPKRKAELSARLLLFFTGVESSAQDILQEQQKNTARNLTSLREMRAMVDHAQKLLVGSEDLDSFGRLLHAAWMHKRSLSSGISNTAIDDAYDAAMRAGAIGGKLLGAGGRGFLLLYARPSQQPKLREAMKGLTEIPFEFSDEGSRVIFRSSES
ncbi:MAG: kinase [Kiritimatiellae bacterium]|nr:kinase [Kiritimatiellia bacterium]